MSDLTEHREFDVLISGASFAGLALAQALSRATAGSLSICLIDPREKKTHAGADVRAFALGAASKNVLEALGVWDEIASLSQPVLSIDITDSPLEAGVRPVLLNYDNRLPESEAASYIVPGAALAQSLERAAAGSAGVSLINPAAIASYTIEAGGAIVTLNDGRTLCAKLLVAADGRNSSLRDLAGIKTVGWDYGQDGIVTIIAHERPHNGKAVQHFLPGGPFAILPLPDQRSCITWSEQRDEARRILALDDASFLAEVEKRFGGKLGPLKLAGPRQSWPLSMHLARQLIANRVVVIGDAAHGVHPIAGQGLNLGLRDVAALTEVLVEAARIGLDIGNARTLEHYERWRRFDNWISATVFDGLNRLFSNDTALLRSAREAGLGIVDRLPGLKKMLVTEAAGLSGEVPRLLRGEPI